MQLRTCTYLVITIAALTTLVVFELNAHSGGLNSEGCHSQTSNNTYHCHQNTKTTKPGQGSEAHHNSLLSKHLDGETEVRLNYEFADETGARKTGFIVVDILTDKYVVEGGLDKRSSLDSIQQVIFASTLAKKKPMIAIYDTDGRWGKIEHRISEVARELDVGFIWHWQGEFSFK